MQLKKRYFGFAVLALTLSISATAFAESSSNDVLSKLKGIQQDGQTSSSEVLLPSLPAPEALSALPTVADIKIELGSNPQDQITDLKATANLSTDAKDHLKLAIAYELTSKNSLAIDSLQKAINLAPKEKELYEELAALNQIENPGKISVFVNGEKLSFKVGGEEVNPAIINGRTLVPIRIIIEKLGGKVDWDTSTLTAKIQFLDTTVQLVQDSKDAIVNGQAVPQLDVPAKNLNGRIVVPLRFIGEQFNKEVSFIPGSNNSAIISINDKP